jgi:F0F1-type ATP synthase assembly protein I
MNNEFKSPWWRPAVLIFSNISGWIVGPIIIALIVGKYLDKKYNSDPWFFLGLTGIAFFISIFGIVKILMKYLKEIEIEAEEKKKSLENKDK